MLKHFTSWLLAAMLLAVPATVGCEPGPGGPLEENGEEAVEETVDETQEAVEEAGDEVEEATE